MYKYEYKIINDQEDGNPDSEYDLNELGKNGWELVSISEDYQGVRKWYFKKKISGMEHITEDGLQNALENEKWKALRHSLVLDTCMDIGI